MSLRAHHGRPGRADPDTGERRRGPRYECQANRFVGALGQKVCAHPVSIGRDALEREVWLRLGAVLQQPGEVERLLRAYREQGGVSEADRLQAAAEREAIGATLDALDRESRNLAEQIARTEDAYSRDVLSQGLAQKGKERTGLLADLQAAEARLAGSGRGHRPLAGVRGRGGAAARPDGEAGRGGAAVPRWRCACSGPGCGCTRRTPRRPSGRGRRRAPGWWRWASGRTSRGRCGRCWRT